jgi:hypothetical protein
MKVFGNLARATWLAGIATSMSGVALARMLAPSLDKPLRLYTTVGGQILALAGLFIIAVGVRNRIRKASAELAQQSPGTDAPAQ